MRPLPGGRLLWGLLFGGALGATMTLLLMPSVPRPPGPEHVTDKVAHAFLFASCAFTAAHAFPSVPRRRIWATLTVLGGILEVVQGSIGRTPSMYDALANAVGAAFAWLVARDAPER